MVLKRKEMMTDDEWRCLATRNAVRSTVKVNDADWPDSFISRNSTAHPNLIRFHSCLTLVQVVHYLVPTTRAPLQTNSSCTVRVP